MIPAAETEFDFDAKSGAFTPQPDFDFAPASATIDGFILTGGKLFRRGDSNQDGNVDLSDAIHSLSFLFTAAADDPTCLECVGRRRQRRRQHHGSDLSARPPLPRRTRVASPVSGLRRRRFAGRSRLPRIEL